MVIAKWNNKVIAKSDKTIVIEGNHYFPPEDVMDELLRGTNHNTICPWKGKANYYSIVVGDKENQNAAWYYPNPSDAASDIKDYIAFWKGVEIVEE